MRTPTSLGRKLTAGVSAFLLTITGLAVGVVAAPAAAADTSPIKQIDSSQVSADALPTVQIDGVAWDQVINGNTVYVGGQFANARPAGAAAGTNLTPRGNLLAYNLTTGALITSFAPTLNAQIKKMAVSPDGTRLYVVGQFTQVNGQNRYRVAAFNTATGALISNFAPVVNSTVAAVVATNTTVYIGGAFSSSGSSFRTRLAAYNASTGARLNWTPAPDAGVNAMTLASDGTIIVGGSFQNVNGSPAYGLAKLDPTTGALLPWNTTNLIRNAGANSAILSLKSDGDQVYGSGYHFGSGGNLEGIFSANAVTGDIKWVEDCHGDTYDVWPGSANTVYSVSHAHYCGNLGGFPQSEPNWGVNMKRSLAFTKDVTGTLGHDPHGYYDFYGTPSPSMVNWFPLLSAGTYTGKSQAAWSVTGNSQYVILGGEFPSVNGTAQQGLVRFAIRSIAPNQSGPVYSGSQSNPSLVALPSGKVRVAWQANTDRDDLTLNYTLTRNGVTVNQTSDSSPFWARANMGYIDSNVTAGQSYTYRLTATDPSGNFTRSDNVSITVPAGGSTNGYAQKVIADGASSYWPLNESTGTALLDNAGFNDIDTSASVTRGTAGAIPGDTATTFDGATSSSTRTPIAGPNTFTSQVWIKTSTTSGGKILGFGGSKTGNSGSYDRHVYMDNAGRIWFGVYPNGVATLNSDASYNDGQWHQITTSLGPDGMKLYIDAKLIGQRGDVTYGQDYSGYWRVGGDNIGGWPNQPASNTFAGAIDDVAIYPTVLTRQTINAQWVASGRTSTIPAAPADTYGAAVFNDNPNLFWRLGESGETTAADASPNGDQTGIYQNGVTLGATGGIKGTSNTAASFDGNDDFVASTKTYNNPKNYSVEAWFKTTTTNGGKIIGLGASQTGTSGGYDRHVYMNNDGKVTFGVWTGFTNTITSNTALNDGVWHHVVASQSTADGMKMYIDGALVGTNGQTDAQDYVGYWRVGGDNHWGCCSPFVTATIDDAAVYGYVLTGAQVANHFNLGNTVVAANQAPVAGFTSSSVYLDATFTNTSTDPDGTIAASEWNFGDSTPLSTTASPTHSYAQAGTYTVSLKVTDNKGETNVVTHPVTVTAPAANVPPTAGISVTSQNLLTVNVSGSGSADGDGTIVDYAWDFGDSGTASGVTASHTYTAAGTYTVTLTVKDDDGASTSTTQSVTVSGPVNQAPVASFVVTPAQLSVTVDGSGSTDPDGTVASWSWEFGDGGTAVGAKPAAHAYASAGTYTITLTVTDNGGAQKSTSQPITVSAPPANNPPSAGFQQLVDGLTANLESTSTDPGGQIVSWAWTFGDNSTDTGAAVTHTYAAGGTYEVTLTVTDNGGATATSTQNVTVVAPVTPNVAPVASFTSSAANLVLSVNGSGSTDSDGTISAYSWEFGDGSTEQVTTATATHTYLAAGTYPVTLTVTDDDGATNAKTTNVTVTTPAPVALVSDAFSRTVTNGFGAADTGGNWTIAGGNTNFSVNGGTGKIRIPTAGSTLTAALGQVTSADVDITLQMALDKPATGGGLYASVSARKVGNTEYRVSPRFTNTGGIQVQLIKVVNGTGTVLQTTTLNSFGYVAGEQVSLRFKVVGSSSVSLQSKVWKSSTTEPTAWQTTATDATAPLTTAGTLQLIAYMSGSSTNAPVVVSYDNLKVFAPTP